MKRYAVNESAPYGLYVSFSPADVRFVGSEGETLEGRSPLYRKLPTALVILCGPVLGGAFVLAFPLVIIVAIASIMTHLVAKRFRKAAEKRVYLIENAWQPQAAFLQGEQEEETAAQDADQDADQDAEHGEVAKTTETSTDRHDPFDDLRDEIAKRKNPR